MSLLLCNLLQIGAASLISTLRIQDFMLGDRWNFIPHTDSWWPLASYFHIPILEDISSQPEYLKHINSVEMSLLMCNLLQIGAASLISTPRIQDIRLGDCWHLNSTDPFLMMSQVSKSTQNTLILVKCAYWCVINCNILQIGAASLFSTLGIPKY